MSYLSIFRQISVASLEEYWDLLGILNPSQVLTANYSVINWEFSSPLLGTDYSHREFGALYWVGINNRSEVTLHNSYLQKGEFSRCKNCN
jgi:hypothetical protein